MGLEDYVVEVVVGVSTIHGDGGTATTAAATVDSGPTLHSSYPL